MGHLEGPKTNDSRNDYGATILPQAGYSVGRDSDVSAAW